MTAIVLGAFLRGPLIIFVHMVIPDYRGSRFQVPGSGFRVPGSGFRVPGFGVRVSEPGTWNVEPGTVVSTGMQARAGIELAGQPGHGQLHQSRPRGRPRGAGRRYADRSVPSGSRSSCEDDRRVLRHAVRGAPAARGNRSRPL